VARQPRPGRADACHGHRRVPCTGQAGTNDIPTAAGRGHSQLDAVNEAALRDTIADAARTTTVLVVAHRLSTVTMADRIMVIDAGRVRAVGTHTELLAADPLSAELAATQFLVAAD
jgi:ABC-type hemin transport system ATPase subunit